MKSKRLYLTSLFVTLLLTLSACSGLPALSAITSNNNGQAVQAPANPKDR